MAEINNWFQYELEINNLIFVDHTTSVDDWLNSNPIFSPPRYARLYSTSNLSVVFQHIALYVSACRMCIVKDAVSRLNKTTLSRSSRSKLEFALSNFVYGY